MALAYTSDTKNRISALLYELQYGSLTGSLANAATVIDNCATDTLSMINQYGGWIEMAGATTAPAAWEHWFVAETAARAATILRSDRPDMVKNLRQMALQARVDALMTFQRLAITYDPSSTTDAVTTNYQTIRYYVLSNTLRRPRPLFINPELIDQKTYAKTVELWNRYDWNFRRRQCTLSIKTLAASSLTYTHSTKTLSATGAFTNYTHVTGALALVVSGTNCIAGTIYEVASKTSANAIVLTTALPSAADGSTDVSIRLLTVTFPDLHSGETFDSLATRKLSYLDTSGDGQHIRWADADEMSRYRVQINTSYGRPQIIRAERVGSTWHWNMHPWPDQDYNCTTEVLVQGPGEPSSPTSSTVFAKFPAEFLPLIKDWVLAECLLSFGDPTAGELLKKVKGEIEAMLPIFARVGDIESDFTVREVRSDPMCDRSVYDLYSGMAGL